METVKSGAYRRKIKFNVWRDPETIKKAQEGREWMSPHCTSGNCKWCTERRARKQRSATMALEAALAPGMFWDSKIGGHQEQLGPSAPDHWLETGVKVMDTIPVDEAPLLSALKAIMASWELRFGSISQATDDVALLWESTARAIRKAEGH